MKDELHISNLSFTSLVVTCYPYYALNFTILFYKIVKCEGCEGCEGRSEGSYKREIVAYNQQSFKRPLSLTSFTPDPVSGLTSGEKSKHRQHAVRVDPVSYPERSTFVVHIDPHHAVFYILYDPLVQHIMLCPVDHEP